MRYFVLPLVLALTLALAVFVPFADPDADWHTVDLYDASGHRVGRMTVDERRQRIELFDADGRRTGYGITRPGGRLDFLDLDGRRIDSVEKEKR